jgi:GT2 family glycosyltransferase
MRGRNRYLCITNRNEKISLGPTGVGYVCLWPYTSKLHAPMLFPRLGQRMLQIACKDWGFSQSDRIAVKADCEITVVIGHRGRERIGHLLTTLRSIAAQREVDIECIVVEQDSESILGDCLPSWVRHIFQRDMGERDKYNRAAAFNCGVNHAKGKIVVLHDNDMIMPEKYCKEIRDIYRKGYEVINVKRFVFYINRSDSLEIMDRCSAIETYKPEFIVQNLEAGGSVAITKKGFHQIGGMDEGFVGWGGEDNEFWDRAASLKRWIWGYLPIIHLWHEAQSLKVVSNNTNIVRAKDLIRIDRSERIRRLKEKAYLGKTIQE